MTTTPEQKKTTKAVKADGIQKLRIRVRAYEYKILDASVRQIMDTALRYDAKVLGPIPLPTQITKYTVNRSTFIYKDAREQFEMRIHKRLIDIVSPTPKIIEALTTHHGITNWRRFPNSWRAFGRASGPWPILYIGHARVAEITARYLARTRR
jgi:small subunit ribosomal protein S10